LFVFAHYSAKGRTIIDSLEKRRPENVTPRAWETAATWASIAYCNVCVVDTVSTSEMKGLVADLEAQSQNDVDLSSYSWLWRRLEATGPSGKCYYEKFWPQHRRDSAYAQASDDSLPTLDGFGECRYLDLRGTLVTDAGLVHLKKAQNLESLALGDGITDAGIAHLSGLTTLRWLSLTGTKVTDGGLEQLQGLPRLAKLYVAASEVSEYMRGVVFKSLQEIHAEVGLRSFYLERSPPMAFPPDAQTFKLGGHDEELGHIHIDFRKAGDRWQLEAVWMCR